MISIETHRDLYLCSPIEKIYNSLQFAKTLNDTYDKTVEYHFYWRVPRDFERKQVLPLKSAIVTQNPLTSRIVLWSNVDLSSNSYLKPLLPFIQFRIWDLKKEIQDSVFNYSDLLNKVTDDELCYLGGDLFRLLCLHKYGGIYVDMDMVLLRDLSPLLQYEFMYQWGSSGTHSGEPELLQNGAIMRLNKNSLSSMQLMHELLCTPPISNSTCWGSELYKKVKKKYSIFTWKVFPCAWFNTEWGAGLTINPFNKHSESNELYDGAFSWHWHNKWDSNIEEGSKFQILESKFDEIFKRYYK